MQGSSFNPSPQLFNVIAECTEHYDVGSPDAEWPNNIISRKAVVYESGVIAREGDIISHDIAPDEVELCRKLSVEARQIIGDVVVGMGSEATTLFCPFFICIPRSTDAPTEITSELIRERFGGTIFPPATITVEPLEESGIWWEEILYDINGSPEYEKAKVFDSWKRLMNWFQAEPQLSSASFIRIGDNDALWALQPDDMPPGTEITGSDLPRLAVALTKHGSLVGIFGYSVQT